jgi:hypothetical protein
MTKNMVRPSGRQFRYTLLFGMAWTLMVPGLTTSAVAAREAGAVAHQPLPAQAGIGGQVQPLAQAHPLHDLLLSCDILHVISALLGYTLLAMAEYYPRTWRKHRRIAHLALFIGAISGVLLFICHRLME